MSGLFLLDAINFALTAHKDQKRKYTNDPYFVHLAEVASLVSVVHSDEDVIATAWLHDCIEDCGVGYEDLENCFGDKVAQGVLLLSDIEEGNRKQRKQAARERLSKAPSWLQDIKVCDLISNTPSIRQYDPKFAQVYLEEKNLLLEVLKKADEDLLRIAKEI